MGLLSTLLTFPVSLPIKGLVFIADKLSEQAEEEVLDDGRVQQELMELEFRHDLGEFDDEEFRAREDALLARLDAIREYREMQVKEQA